MKFVSASNITESNYSKKKKSKKESLGILPSFLRMSLKVACKIRFQSDVRSLQETLITTTKPFKQKWKKFEGKSGLLQQLNR